MLPDPWQHTAVTHLRAGSDVIVSAPTGAGKTLVFELFVKSAKLRTQAVYTVPTRALANDKYAEWKAAGWQVGLATGDVSENVRAPVLVATLETQLERLLTDDGPSILVLTWAALTVVAVVLLLRPSLQGPAANQPVEVSTFRPPIGALFPGARVSLAVIESPAS